MCTHPNACTYFQKVPRFRKLHVYQGNSSESQLRVHELRQLWVGFTLCLPPHDTGLLGESVHAGM